MNVFQKQKYLTNSIILTLNIILSILSILYQEYWYIFLIILAMSSLMNSFYAISLIIKKIYDMFYLENNTNYNYNDKNLALVIPCYNETINELNLTFDSIYKQKNIPNKKIMYIICDGTNKTSDNLLEIFESSIIETHKFNRVYKTWDNIFEGLNIYCGIRNNINFMIFVKEKNKGKRDSLTLIRRLLFYYNRRCEYNIESHSNILKNIDKDFLNFFIANTNKFLLPKNKNRQNIIDLISSDDRCSINSGSSDIFNDINTNVYINIDTNDTNDTNDIIKIDYIYGTDADTELDEYCIKNLLIDLVKSDKNTVASVGFVDLFMKDTYFNVFKIYQFAEYYTAQLLRRNFQSTFTKKVNCLSGCNQLIKICDETCGEKILEIFNKKPEKNANIFKQILSTASEDRNHVTLMFQLFPYIKTIQTINAKVYTKVPLNLKHFISQRKRWNLGAFFNDILILQNKKHNLIERIQSLINIVINSFTIFVFVATIHFIINIIKHPNLLMLYLSIIMFIPITYNLLTPIIKYRNNIKLIGYYYLSYLFYLMCGPFINIFLHLYTLFKIDDFSWNIYKK
jgi:chitin synthase